MKHAALTHTHTHTHTYTHTHTHTVLPPQNSNNAELVLYETEQFQ